MYHFLFYISFYTWKCTLWYHWNEKQSKNAYFLKVYDTNIARIKNDWNLLTICSFAIIVSFSLFENFNQFLSELISLDLYYSVSKVCISVLIMQIISSKNSILSNFECYFVSFFLSNDQNFQTVGSLIGIPIVWFVTTKFLLF